MFLAVAVSLDLETVGTLLLGVILAIVAYSDWKLKRAKPDEPCRKCLQPMMVELKSIVKAHRATVATWAALDAERTAQLNRTLERLESAVTLLREHMDARLNRGDHDG